MNIYICTTCSTPCTKPPCGGTSGPGHWTCPKCGPGAKVRRTKKESKV